MYESLAGIYDKLIGFDHEGYFSFVAPYLKGEGLDLACGSGIFTALAARAGHKMTGIDSSPEMLNAAEGRCSAEWVLADISRIKIPENTYGFVTCVCDGFNYLSPRALARTINNIYAALDGIKNKSIPPKEVTENLFDSDSAASLKLDLLPSTLEKAHKNAAASKFITTYLGKEFIKKYGI